LSKIGISILIWTISRWEFISVVVTDQVTEGRLLNCCEASSYIKQDITEVQMALDRIKVTHYMAQ